MTQHVVTMWKTYECILKENHYLTPMKILPLELKYYNLQLKYTHIPS